MKRHAAMNRTFRLVWSQVLNAWVVVSEVTNGRGKSSVRKLLAAVLLSAGAAQAAPLGGQVISGAGSVAQSGATTTVTQSSANLSLNWQSFNIALTETVNFVQPSAAAVAVNRIFDTNGSQILGHLNANGQVYLINPNGILFGQGAQVNVGGLVASTLDLKDASLGGSARVFGGSGTGRVVNQGAINATSGGYVALLGNVVSNQGTVTAPLGTVALGAGNAVTLNFNGNSLVKMQVDQSVLNSLADNGGLIKADGGLVLMNAGAKDALLASVVNNTGKIEARTVENHEGTITLLGGMAAGTVNVGGTLDASAPHGGNGGFIETSAAHVHVAGGTLVTTQAAIGQTGQWLIDPNDYTIAASGGDITGAALSTALGTANVTILSTAGASGSAGNVNVNDAVSWSANTLTLNAQNNININANLNATNTAGLALQYGQSTTIGVGSSVNISAQVNLASTGSFSTMQGSSGATTNYTIITRLGSAGSTTSTDLQGMNGNLAGNYVLGSNVDASATSSWNSGAGFSPIGLSWPYFTGNFNGLGHTISGLTINLPSPHYVGLFSQIDRGSVINNVGIVNASVIGGTIYTGALAGVITRGTISNSYATGSVSGSYSSGGLVGGSFDTIDHSYATATVTALNFAGGLVGRNGGTVSNSYATGNALANGSVGGLIGTNYGIVNTSYATGQVSGTGAVGGLVGDSGGGGMGTGTVSNSFWDTSTTGQSTSAGGGTGLTTAQLLTQSSYSGFDFTNTWYMVDGSTRPFLRSEYNTSISNAHQLQMMGLNLSASYNLANNIDLAAELANPSGMWGGSSAGFAPIGNTVTPFIGKFNGLSHSISDLMINRPSEISVGLFGVMGNGADSTATISNVGLVGGSVTGYGRVGGLVGNNLNDGTISNSYVTGNVTGNWTYIGGLVGYNEGTISNSYATGAITGTNTSYVGGLVGGNFGAIGNSYAKGGVIGSSNVGGLVGGNGGSVSNSFWDTTTSGQASSNGTGLATSSMMQLASFSNWNIANTGGSGAIWRIYEGHTTPLLSSFMTPLTLANTSVTYNSSIQTGATSSVTGVLGAAGTGTNVGTYSGYYSNQQGYNISGGNLIIGAKDVTVSGLTVSDKNYNGSATAVLSGAAVLTGGAVSDTDGKFYTNDALTLSGTAVGNFVDANAGTGKIVTVSGYTLGNNTSGNYALALVAQPGLSANINKANLTLSGTRVYNGGTAYAGANLSATGVNGETFSVNGSGDVTNLASKNVQSGSTLASLTGLTLGSGNTGAAIASNYNALSTTGSSVNVTAANLTLSGTQVYNGGTAFAGANLSAVGVNGETFSVSGAGDASNLVSKNVQSGSTLASVTGLAVGSGNTGAALASNYNALSTVGSSVNVTAANLSLSTSNVSKTYDAGLAALGTAVKVDGLTTVNGDTLSGGTFAFTDKNAGSGKTVTTSGVTINDGNNGANYNVSYVDNTTSSITKAPLSYTAIPVSFFNGQTPNNVSGSVTGFVSGETLANATSGTLTWATSANSNSPPGSYAIDGNGLLASNYLFSQAALNATALTLQPSVAPVLVLNARTQLYSGTESPQTSGQSSVFNVSPTIKVTQTNNAQISGTSPDATSKPDSVVSANTTIGMSATTPTLQIVNGGVRLPLAMVNVNE